MEIMVGGPGRGNSSLPAASLCHSSLCLGLEEDGSRKRPLSPPTYTDSAGAQPNNKRGHCICPRPGAHFLFGSLPVVPQARSETAQSSAGLTHSPVGYFYLLLFPWFCLASEESLSYISKPYLGGCTAAEVHRFFVVNKSPRF